MSAAPQEPVGEQWARKRRAPGHDGLVARCPDNGEGQDHVTSEYESDSHTLYLLVPKTN